MPAPTEPETRYRIVRRLAAGGMGEVLLVEFTGDETAGITPGLVVVKRTFQNAPNRSHQDRMLREEGRVAMRLLHANLVETFFLDEVEGVTLLVMEYLAGRSVAQVLGNAKRTRKPLPIPFAVRVLRDAACGLHFAHTLHDKSGRPLGLIHRDVSPANLFVTFDGRLKVIDFGVAKADDSEIRTSTGILKGKLGYMSPEHALGSRLTAATDMWSLGVVLWETLVAERLFHGENPSVTLYQITQRDIPPPSSMRPEISPAVDALCARLLMRDTDRRLATGEALVQAIDALPEAKDVHAVDLGEVLRERFQEDVDQGMEEAMEAARVRRVALVPSGLVDGRSQIEPDLEDQSTLVVNTVIMSNLARSVDAISRRNPAAPFDDKEARTKQSAQSAFDERPPAPHLATVSLPLSSLPFELQHSAKDPLMAEPSAPSEEPSAPSEEPSAPTQLDPRGLAPVRPQLEVAPDVTRSLAPQRKNTSSYPPIQAGGERSQTRTRSSPDKRSPSSEPGPLAIGLMTFGAFAVVLGVGFSLLARERLADVPPAVIAYDNGSGDVLVARLDAVPPEKRSIARTVLLTAPVLRAPGQAAPTPVDANAVLALAARAGLLAQLSLPPDARALAGSAMPALMFVLGLFAMAYALPDLSRSRRKVRRMLRATLMGFAAAVALVGALRGLLSWPGAMPFTEEPRRVEWRAPP